MTRLGFEHSASTHAHPWGPSKCNLLPQLNELEELNVIARFLVHSSLEQFRIDWDTDTLSMQVKTTLT